VFNGIIVVVSGTPSVNAVANDPPLQMVSVLGVTNGFGFIDTVTVNVSPTQFPYDPDVGVTV
jgi:hypothetical protein